MAQQFRAGGRSNRSGRSQADADVFEGLPVRQWISSDTIVGLPPPTEVVQGGDNALPELPMPRDSHLLSALTQQLLREARRPRLAKRPQEPTEDDKQEEEEEGEPVQTGWQSKKWSQVPSHQEKPEREFLAKRRKGLPSMHTQIALQAANAVASSANTRKTKIMKSDADGNTTVYEVLVPEGQTVEGEVADDAIMADAAPVQAAPGTVIDGVGIANAEGVFVATDLLQQQQQPMRRKPIPPRRIRKGGPGRGKKKVMFNPNEGHNAAATSTPGGGVSVATPSTLNANADDSAMDIDSTPKPDGNDEGDDEDGEEGEDGDEDDDREDGEVSEGEELQEEEPAEIVTSPSTKPDAEEQVPAATEPAEIEEAPAPVTEEPVAPTEEVSVPVTESAPSPIAEEHELPVPAVVEAVEEQGEAIEAVEAVEAIEAPEAVEAVEAIEATGAIEAIEAIEDIEHIEATEELSNAEAVEEATDEPEGLAMEEAQVIEEPEAAELPQEPSDKEPTVDTTAGSEKSEEDTTMKEASDKETEES
ncbi:unnamed protein product [Aureobasidium uvarum]|uniref:Uncharacterized protein n=1 Tax=Aureobasidium uvarum TaxID=2773716 RepID=A0A9N8KLF3_9PEZI|nr:unnamed protein product [Aureobasidium uvarum]